MYLSQVMAVVGLTCTALGDEPIVTGIPGVRCLGDRSQTAVGEPCSHQLAVNWQQLLVC